MALNEHAGPRCQGGACCTDCRGVVTVPSSASKMDAVTKNVEYYSLAHFSALVPAGSTRIKTQRGKQPLHSPDGACGAYCATGGCGWTKEYSCPWAAKPGTKGRAGDDGSQGYECCCVERTSASQPCGGNGTAPSSGSLQFVAFRTPGNETVLQVLCVPTNHLSTCIRMYSHLDLTGQSCRAGTPRRIP